MRATGFSRRLALRSVRVLRDRVIVEDATAQDLYRDPKHPYTRLLLQSFPDIDQRDRRLRAIPGSPPRLEAMPAGCQFAPRCPFVFERCYLIPAQPPCVASPEDSHPLPRRVSRGGDSVARPRVSC